MNLSPVDLENKNEAERDSFLDEVTGGEPAVQQEQPKPEEAKPEVVEKTADKVAEIVAPDKKAEVEKKPTDPLDRLAAKKKPEAPKVEETKKPEEKVVEGSDAEKKAAEEKKQYKWGELKKAAEEDLPKAIADRDAALAEREKLSKDIADLRAVAEERDRLKQESEALRTRLYVHDVRELPQYKENRENIDGSEAAMKKASEIHKFPLSDLQAALAITDETERAVKVDEVLDSAVNPVGSTTRARLAGMVEDVVARKGYETYLETNQKAALEAHKMRESQQTQAQKAKENEVYGAAAKQALDRMKGSIPQLADEAMAKRVAGVPRITEQPPHLQAAAAYALEFLPDILEQHEEEIAGHKAHSAEKDEKIKELEGIVAKYSGAGASVKSSGDVKTKEAPKNFLDELEDAQRSGMPIS